VRRSLGQGQPILPAFGPLVDPTNAERYRLGQRPFSTCTWCGTKTALSLAPQRGVICPLCDR
jgi:hypothetical protein